MSFWLLLPSLFSQNIDNQYIRFGSAQGTSLCTDLMGTLYLINGNTLSKLSPAGEVIATYANFQLGEISSVDVDNPLKIMLFYKETGSIVFLDAQLTPIMETLSLFENNFYSISLATFASDESIWMYDDRTKELVAIDFYMNVKQRISLSNHDLAPTELLSLPEKYIFLHNPATGIMLFDSFGTYIKNISLITPHNVQVFANQIVYNIDGQLYLYDFQSLEQKNIASLADKNAQAIIWNNKVLFIRDNQLFLLPIE